MNARNSAHLLVALCLSAFIVTDGYGKTIDKNVQRRLQELYENKTLMLRNFYRGDKLKYNSEGVLVSGGVPGIWTLDSFIKISKLEVDKKKIKLSGKRKYWSYDQKIKKPHYFERSSTTEIEIGLLDMQQNLASLNQVIERIFLLKGEYLYDFVPDYWVKLVTQFFRDNDTEIHLPPSKPPKSHSTNATEPVLLKKINPQFTPLARKAGIQGTIILSGIVSRNGKLKESEIEMPLGLGLEENTVKSLSQWEWAPGQYNGNPVDYPVLIEVSFERLTPEELIFRILKGKN